MKRIDAEIFQESLSQSNPSTGWPSALRALWWDAKGNWSASHDIAQELHTSMGSWIHAYLHRKEGDDWNAGYWYRQAGKPFPESSLDQEFQELLQTNLEK